MAVTEKERIQSALTAAAEAGPFYAEEYDPDTERLTINRGKVISPTSAISDETGSTWRQSRNRRQGFKRERASWNFKLIVAFSQRVSTAGFEQKMADEPICLPRDSQRGLSSTVLLLTNVVYSHPPRQESASGTTVEIFFEAQLSPS